MKLNTLLATLAATAFVAMGSSAQAAEGTDDAALLKALPTAKIGLREGLQAASAKGRPISGKFEMEGDKLQLSVYVGKDGKFSEVIVDHGKGTVTKVEAITGGEDLAAAQAQWATLGKVKEPLKMAVAAAEHNAPGYRAVSVTPEAGSQGAVAKITLAKQGEHKAVEVPIR